RRLDLPRGAEPRVDHGAPALAVLRELAALVGVVVRDRAVAEELVEPVEGAVPAREHVAAAGREDRVLERPARGDDDPFEVVLAPEVTGRGGRGADLGEVEPVVVRGRE